MRRLNKLGFTLVELLAVIVILGIILVIAVPAISNAINGSTKKAFIVDAEMVLKTVKYKMLGDEDFDSTTINEANVGSILNISNVNYKSLIVREMDGVPNVTIIGKNKWNNLVVTGTAANVSLYEGLALWYDFSYKTNTDTDKGTVADFSGNGNTATLSGFGYTAGSGWTGTALAFDGSNDNLTMTSFNTGNANWTFSIWVKTTGATDKYLITNSSGGPVYNALCISTSKIAYYHYDTAWKWKYGTSTVNNDAWHLLTWVNYSNSTMDLYVDGVREATGVASLLGTAGPVNIIGRNWGATYFAGSMSDIKYYRRSLTEAEIAIVYDSEKLLSR